MSDWKSRLIFFVQAILILLLAFFCWKQWTIIQNQKFSGTLWDRTEENGRHTVIKWLELENGFVLYFTWISEELTAIGVSNTETNQYEAVDLNPLPNEP